MKGPAASMNTPSSSIGHKKSSSNGRDQEDSVGEGFEALSIALVPNKRDRDRDKTGRSNRGTSGRAYTAGGGQGHIRQGVFTQPHNQALDKQAVNRMVW